MLGSFRRRGCLCKKKRCTCGSKWTYRYHIIDPQTGKRKQKETRGFDTKEEAENEAKRILMELQNGAYVEEKDATFADFEPEFIRIYQVAGQVKKSSVQVRRGRLKLLRKYLGGSKLKNITRKQYQDVLIDLHDKGYARETIISVHATGKLFFNKAAELGVIRNDPTQYAVIPGYRKTVEELERNVDVPKYLEKEELALFLNAAKYHGLDEKDYTIFLTLAYTGLRVGELCVLKWSDISTKDCTISITKTLYNERNNTAEYGVETPKTKRSKRVIEVSRKVMDELERHRARQNLVRMEHRKTYHDKDFVFVKGRPYYGYPEFPKNIEGRMRRLLKISSLNTALTPHSLRHTHTSLLAVAKVTLETIQDRLGHKDDATTRNIYLHVTKELKKEASQKFDDLMGELKF